MNVEFEDRELAQLEESGASGRWQPVTGKAFRKLLRYIRRAADERDFYAMNSLNFEKMRSNEAQHSMRINNQYRLIVELRGKGSDKIVHIIAIVDYH